MANMAGLLLGGDVLRIDLKESREGLRLRKGKVIPCRGARDPVPNELV